MYNGFRIMTSNVVEIIIVFYCIFLFQDKTLSVNVLAKDYLDKLAEQANMEVMISAQVTRENNQHSNVVKVDNFRLRRPDIEIKVSCLFE
jgi:hypothetical protein